MPAITQTVHERLAASKTALERIDRERDLAAEWITDPETRPLAKRIHEISLRMAG